MSERNQALADRFQNRESECQPADSGDFRRNAGVDWCRSLRTTVRTKAAETVETRGHYWPLQAGTERGFIQAIAHIWQLMAALGIFCPGPRQNYGSEGWGFESLRARRVSPVQRPFHPSRLTEHSPTEVPHIDAFRPALM